ncbi:MAG: DUF433 domain-containing protein [Acidimicrobiia bacterium]|nr:DUF433 domain-containing protein [Acidimicrobiia bacterium]
MDPLSILDAELYEYREIDKYLGLPSGTARRWINGYTRGVNIYPPVIRESALDSGRLATFGELVETYYLAAFRAGDHPLQRIRPVVERLREEHGTYPFARERVLKADGIRKEAVRVLAPGLGENLRTGQVTWMEEAEARMRTIEFDHGLAVRLAPRLGLPQIVIDGVRHSGAPVIRGTSIRPHAVARLVQAGDEPARIAAAYKIPERTLDAAGRFVFGDQ